MAELRWPIPGRADRNVTHLTILRQIAEQYEITQGVAHRLLMQRRLEDPRVELRRRRRIGNDDVEVLQPEVVER